MKELTCPQCGSTQIATERRPDGYHKCVDCHWSWKNESPLTEHSSGTTIPIESRKDTSQDEPFPGYTDSLKARIRKYYFKRGLEVKP